MPFYDRDTNGVSSNKAKRFWSNRYWPSYGRYRVPWQPLNKKLDQYRFMMKGLGKRSGRMPKVQNLDFPEDNQEYPTKLIVCKNCDQNDGSVGSWKKYLISTKTYADILNSLNKRTPEVYSQDLYPIQDGTQRMEVELDRKLDNLMEDDHSSDLMDTIINYDAQNLGNTETLTPGVKDIDRKATVYIIDDTKMPFNEDEKRDAIQERSKKWWAARRLKLFGLKTPKSVIGHQYRKQHIDPVLYLIGLGR